MGWLTDKGKRRRKEIDGRVKIWKGKESKGKEVKNEKTR